MAATTLANPTDQPLDLEELNSTFAVADPEKIVAWAAARFGPQLVMTSSFGVDSALLLHMATRVLSHIRVIFVDTGYHFPETFQHMEHLRQRLNLNIWIYHTRNDPIAYLHAAGEQNPQFRNDAKACCAANKNEPIDRAMRELAPAAYLRGVRRDQTEERRVMHHIEWAQRYRCHAIQPALNWTTRDIYYYMKKYDLPFHPLNDKGYKSVGCNPLSCTRPIQIGEDSRAGRWAGSDKVECGINLTNSLDSSNL